ncbi:MAG: dipeptide epimerase [Ignavibacteriaceae bacterium]
MLKLFYYPFNLKLKSRFTLSTGSRYETPAVLLELKYENLTGYGEASLPPYLGTATQDVLNEFGKLERMNFNSPGELEDYFTTHQTELLNIPPAAAALDTALYDLKSKMNQRPLYELLGLPEPQPVETSYTITYDTEENLKRNLDLAEDYKILKVKIGTPADDEFIRMLRRFTDKPFFADVNQGWKSFEEAILKTKKIASEGALLIEQPLPTDMVKETARLRRQSPVPIIADESVQSLRDLDIAAEAFDGINVKLMKCGGIRQAVKLMNKAKEMNLKIMLGCMTETSCAVSAALHISSLADFHDLDGALLISNDLFSGIRYQNGRISIKSAPGLGISKIANN